MNERTPEQTDAIIEAAAAGEPSPTHPELGDFLNQLHGSDPVVDMGSAPPVSTGARRLWPTSGRIARRTAAAASVAVFGLVGVAAASTGAIDFLAPRRSTPVIVEDQNPDSSGLDSADPASSGLDSADPASADPASADPSSSDPEDSDAVLEEVVPPEPEPDVSGPEAQCEQAETHGDYVSSVAQDKTGDSDKNHGERVSKAAHSDCGKTDPDGDGVEETKDVDDDTDDTNDTDGSSPTTTVAGDTKPGHDDSDLVLTPPGKAKGPKNGKGPVEVDISPILDPVE